MFTVRPAVESDVTRIAEIVVAGWRRAYVGIVPQEFLDNMSVDERALRFRDAFFGDNPESCLVAEDSNTGEVLGFCGYGHAREADGAEIFGLYVDPECLRRGIGTALFNAAAHVLSLSGFTMLIVWTPCSNPFRAFYDKRGGQPLADQMLSIGGCPVQLVGYHWNLPLTDG